MLADAGYLGRLTEKAENRPYFVIDDCWQRDRYHADGTYEEQYNGGPWVPNQRFGDMESLAAEIRAKNVIPGIWVRLLQDHSPEIPADWRLPHTGGLDPSRPEVLPYGRAGSLPAGGAGACAADRGPDRKMGIPAAEA